MNSIIHKSETRGNANHGWLQSRHSFSFAEYYHPKRMNFGVLRVLNDDTVAPGMGFATHPHNNMEIISIPLEGDLEHRDNMGNVAVIRSGDIQVMSAGTGISHSEFNRNKHKSVKFLQIWIHPDTKNVMPRYDQLTINVSENRNKLIQILSPNPEDEGVWIHQKAWFSMGHFDSGIHTNYSLKQQNNGVYAFVIRGQFKLNDTTLDERDGMGLWNARDFSLTCLNSGQILLMDIPMIG